ncbi:MAG: acetyl-CoA carboxylase biotin carboxylase subunit [Candidatus Competibacterales bacterium]
MFSKLLIANRGEIAVRVIKTARRMGIKTVAVFSEADREALHVQLADEAVYIGPPPSSQSYLVIDRLVQACLDSGAQAVHPGYGFLSENAAFAEALGAAGVTFVGPPPGAIRAMGDKLAAKRLAIEAGVSTVPGFAGEVADGDHAVAIARDIGYPVMLKAAAGGGGKGMRVAHDDAGCREGLARAKSEAKASFGDDRVLIEKFIEQPRHIEIQLLADGAGNAVYLGERECSIQRRHQKVIEEAPSPFLDGATRRAMGEQSVALAQKVGYASAGTVEFIVDQNRQFYFLEMNTRLQVEHPVTEMITGLDLVELMIRVAAGESLPFGQDDLALQGWSMEARVYAEDPRRGFLPSIGRLVRYKAPAEGEGVRLDTGFVEGSEVTMHYDPLVAKLITYGGDREQARLRMLEALNGFYLQGVSHNVAFLAAIVNHPRFRAGELSTHFIDEAYPEGFAKAQVVSERPFVVPVVAAVIHRRYMDRAAAIAGQMSGHERRVAVEWRVLWEDSYHPVIVRPTGMPPELAFEVTYGGCTHQVVSDWRWGQGLFRGTIDNVGVCVQVERRDLVYHLSFDGIQASVWVMSPRAAELHALMPQKAAPDLSRFLLSPMPGLLTKLLVGAGAEVKAGQDLAIVEAMKMENVLKAQSDGVVAEVLATEGEGLAVDQPILAFA